MAFSLTTLSNKVEPEGILETSGEIVRTLSTPSPRSVDFDTQPQPQAKNKIRSSTGYSSSLSPFAYQEKEIDSPVTAEARSFRAGSLPTVFLPPIPTPHRKKSLGFVYQLPLLGSPSTEFEGFEFSDEDGLGLSGDLSPKVEATHCLRFHVLMFNRCKMVIIWCG